MQLFPDLKTRPGNCLGSHLYQNNFKLDQKFIINQIKSTDLNSYLYKNMKEKQKFINHFHECVQTFFSKDFNILHILHHTIEYKRIYKYKLTMNYFRFIKLQFKKNSSLWM